MQVAKVICPICGQEISKSNYNKHLRRHQNHPETFKKDVYHVDHDDLYCKFCNKECKNKHSLTQHELRCRKNPSRRDFIKENFNDGSRAAWNKGLTKETDDRIAKQSVTLKNTLEQTHDKNFGGLRRSSARKCKYGTYKNIYCDSGWELAFVIYCIDNNVNFKRNTQGFPYSYKDKIHTYYPDFIVDGVFVEIKGIMTDQDVAKINQFPNELTLEVVDRKSIQKYLKYAKEKYGENFTTLYDDKYPNWMTKNDLNRKYNFSIHHVSS